MFSHQKKNKERFWRLQKMSVRLVFASRTNRKPRAVAAWPVKKCDGSTLSVMDGRFVHSSSRLFSRWAWNESSRFGKIFHRACQVRCLLKACSIALLDDLSKIIPDSCDHTIVSIVSTSAFHMSGYISSRVISGSHKKAVEIGTFMFSLIFFFSFSLGPWTGTELLNSSC